MHERVDLEVRNRLTSKLLLAVGMVPDQVAKMHLVRWPDAIEKSVTIKHRAEEAGRRSSGRKLRLWTKF